jgi:hypothetical protein
LFGGAELCYAFSPEFLLCLCSLLFCGSQRTVDCLLQMWWGFKTMKYFTPLLIYSWTVVSKFVKNKDWILE